MEAISIDSLEDRPMHVCEISDYGVLKMDACVLNAEWKADRCEEDAFRALAVVHLLIFYALGFLLLRVWDEGEDDWSCPAVTWEVSCRALDLSHRSRAR